MEVLANELAKLLNITVEKALELYPVLKQQFMWYNIISSVSFIFGAMFWVSLVIAMLSGISYLCNLEYIDSDSRYNEAEKKLAISCKKIYQQSLKVFIVGILGISIASILKYLLSPDFMIIKEFIIK